jgi:hypothetical protein
MRCGELALAAQLHMLVWLCGWWHVGWPPVLL